MDQLNDSERAELIKLRLFKKMVHERLDRMLVPLIVASPHTDAGCRIGGRLDYVEAMLMSRRDDMRKLSHAISTDIFPSYDCADAIYKILEKWSTQWSNAQDATRK